MSKQNNHFDAVMVFDEDSIRKLFRVEYHTFERSHILARFGIAAVLLVLAILTAIPTPAKAICMLVGCWLLASRDFPSDIRAEGVLQQRKGVVSKVHIAFGDEDIRIEGGQVIRYKELERLVEDKTHFYLFKDKQTAVVIPKSGLVPNSPLRFVEMIARKSGKTWKNDSTSFLTMNLKDLLEMRKDRTQK